MQTVKIQCKLIENYTLAAGYLYQITHTKVLLSVKANKHEPIDY